MHLSSAVLVVWFRTAIVVVSDTIGDLTKVPVEVKAKPGFPALFHLPNAVIVSLSLTLASVLITGGAQLLTHMKHTNGPYDLHSRALKWPN